MKTKWFLVCVALAGTGLAAAVKPGIPADLKDAAERGDARAQYEMGQAYTRGQLVPMDHAQAVAWYRRAVAQGYAPAEQALGSRLMNGRGVPKNQEQGARLIRSAAEKGNARAQFLLGGIYEKGTGLAKDPVAAVNWYRKAAEQGEQSGQRALGEAYASGTGAPQDFVQAYVWLNLAGDADLNVTPGMQRERRAQLKRWTARFREVESKLSAGQKAEAAKLIAARADQKKKGSEVGPPP